MKFFSFEEIRQHGDCVAYAEQVLGIRLKNGRCAATWRGGDGDNVAIQSDKWFDHRSKQGGGIIELAATAKHGGNLQLAQQELGEWLGLEPKRVTVKQTGSSRRHDDLIAKGYTEVKRYNYEDEDGRLVHFVARMEHPNEPKEFLQGTPDGWGLRDTQPILYRLRDWIDSSWVCIVEGEKDADTLAELGFPATTNSGGADKWRPEYADKFNGKKVVICRDNDDAGRKHAYRVAAELKEAATEIRIICPSNEPKGDITDYITSEGGNRESLMALIRDANPIDTTDLRAPDPIVEAAKRANERDFKNYTEVKIQVGNVTKVNKSPRQINELVDEIHTRFCGFPRRVKGAYHVFDHDRDTGEIVEIYDASGFISWMGRKSRRRIMWGQGEGFVTKPELFRATMDEAMTYEAISKVPDWPRRNDVYYTYPELPNPNPDAAAFETLVDFFTPASPGYRTLLKALIAAPIWYCTNIPRPAWVIDSDDGAGVGKTTLVEMVATLYNGQPIRTNRNDLARKFDELNKRLVSSEGRKQRILLVDNVVGTFHSAELADLITSMSISGRAPYGRGEETRPNNLTYMITSNSASMDNDLSDRCYFVHVKRPKRSSTWKSSVNAYIERNRMQIFSDIMHTLETADPLECDPATRFPEFEEAILRGVCRSYEEYESAINALVESRQASNTEEENARTIEDEFSSRLIDCNRRPGSEMIFIRTEVVRKWMDEILPDIPVPVQYIRNLAKNNLTPRFASRPDRFPNNGPARRRGIMWIPEQHDGGATRIIGIKNHKIVEII